MNFIDTHVHLYDPEFKNDIDNVIENAKKCGILKVILPAIDFSCHELLISTAQKYPDFAFPTIGLHPTSVKKGWEKELEFVFENIHKHNYCAIGEIGMDGYWSKDFMKEQAIVFRQQIELASKNNLPIIVHSRDATEEIFDVLESVKHLNISGVFHAFSGSYETYLRFNKYGNFKIGIGGVLTFKNSSLASVVEKIDLSEIVLETDAPWLTPTPNRGKRNEPSYLPLIAKKISEIKKCSLEEVAQVTSKNAIELFKI